jgi:hypothetical protein
VKALDPNATLDLTCPYDKEETKTIFTIAANLPLDVRLRIRDSHQEFGSETSEDGKTSKRTTRFSFGARNKEIVQYGLKGLQYLQDSQGKTVAIQFTKDADGRQVVTEGVLEALNIPVGQDGFDLLLDWLASKIWNANSVTEEEAKN